MKCPFCNSLLENGYCKTCERQIHELYRHPKKSQKNNEEVIEPELVDENSEQYTQQHSQQHFSQHFGKRFGQSPIFTQYTFNTVNVNNSCMTGFISLALIFFVALQMGFLAGLGFAFFTIIGKIISAIITFKSLLNGKIIPPLAFDLAIWIISYCLVSWLAS